MIVSIMQPAYLPWPGYFHRIMASDVHVVLDNVDIDLNSRTKFANRNRIRTPQGFSWLTVPLRGDSPSRRIDELRVFEESGWRRTHLRTLDQFYSKAPHYAAHREAMHDLIAPAHGEFMPTVMPITDYLCKALGLSVPCVHASTLGITSTKSELILDICTALGASTYISGPFGRTYLDAAAFASRGVRLLIHEYSPKPYAQYFPDFVPALSVIDMLFNHGHATQELIRAGQENALSEE